MSALSILTYNRVIYKYLPVVYGTYVTRSFGVKSCAVLLETREYIHTVPVVMPESRRKTPRLVYEGRSVVVECPRVMWLSFDDTRLNVNLMVPGICCRLHGIR